MLFRSHRKIEDLSHFLEGVDRRLDMRFATVLLGQQRQVDAYCVTSLAAAVELVDIVEQLSFDR